jgi:hypothetical protein
MLRPSWLSASPPARLTDSIPEIQSPIRGNSEIGGVCSRCLLPQAMARFTPTWKMWRLRDA